MKKLLPILILLVACGREAELVNPDSRMLRDAAKFLWEKQSADGGWHSEIHGILRGGQAYTPYLLNALLQVPDSIYPAPEDKIEKALGYLRAHVNKDGVIGMSDPEILEYPNYSTAYALMCFVRAGKEEDKERIEIMQNYLVSQQYDEDRGFTPDSLAYGGWGFGEIGMPPGRAGQIDLSHTRRVLEAIRMAGYRGQAAYDKAKIFLSILQKNPQDARRQPGAAAGDTSKVFFDGGFYYSPIVLLSNKAGLAPAENGYQAHYRSYASATADGLIALLASGEAHEGEKVKAASGWLQKHSDWKRPEGIPEEDPADWDHVVVIYHVCSRAEAFNMLEKYSGASSGKTWKKEMLAFLSSMQQPDGSFSNPEGARNKEDDPLLGTAFAVNALCAGLTK